MGIVQYFVILFIAAIIKDKLNSIRTIYTRVRRKKTTGSGLIEVNGSKFSHYDRLQFLNELPI